MAKLEATKTIEAKKMNKRNRQTLAELPVTIPYGAILDDVIENRDMMEFLYLGELYCCKSEILRPASRSLDGSQPVCGVGGRQRFVVWGSHGDRYNRWEYDFGRFGR